MYSDTSLTISDLWVERGERELLKSVSFSAQSGDLVHLCGANGVGKSSLFKVLLGLITPLQGVVTFNGQDVSQSRQNFLQNVLYIGHSIGLKGSLTVEENLRWFRPNTSCQKMTQTLVALGIVSFSDAPVQTLSAGQARRVALARLWLSDQSIWLLDEPFSALDYSMVDLLEIKISQHIAAKGVVILTSHSPLANLLHRRIEL